MKKTFDKNGRTLYKFSHSVAQGGNAYIHKTANNRIIENKSGLKNALDGISKKFRLIDSTIKVYNTIFFFFFFVPKSLAPAEIVESIQKNISSFSEWDSDYVFDGVYDLQEKFIRKDLEKFGFNFDEG